MTEITIKLPKMLLILTEQELIQALAASPEIFRKAIGRGKGFKRSQRVIQYEKEKEVMK